MEVLIPVSPAPSSMKHLISANLDQPPTWMEAGEISDAPVPVGNAVKWGVLAVFISFCYCIVE